MGRLAVAFLSWVFFAWLSVAAYAAAWHVADVIRAEFGTSSGAAFPALVGFAIGWVGLDVHKSSREVLANGR